MCSERGLVEHRHAVGWPLFNVNPGSPLSIFNIIGLEENKSKEVNKKYTTCHYNTCFESSFAVASSFQEKSPRATECHVVMPQRDRDLHLRVELPPPSKYPRCTLPVAAARLSDIWYARSLSPNVFFPFLPKWEDTSPFLPCVLRNGQLYCNRTGEHASMHAWVHTHEHGCTQNERERNRKGKSFYF